MTFDDDLPPLGEGDMLAEKYRVERVLGVGGVGVVVSAMHVALGQRVALKFLRRSAAQNPSSVERFLREARAVVRLKSHHSVRVLDVGTLESGVPYMVMELLDGSDFGSILQKRGRLPVAEAVSYVLQACEALAEAHAAGVVHRDLKPENLFMTTGVDHLPLVKVLDFGLVKEMNQPEVGPGGKSLTGALAMGTPAYMSPEQIKSTRDVDARADIWSMGVVLYELLSGQLPFDAASVPELIAAIVRDPPRPLADVAPDVPAKLAAVIARCLEKAPELRFTKIASLAAALDEFSGADPYSAGTGARLKLVQPSVLPPPTPNLAWPPAPNPIARLEQETISASTLGDAAPSTRKRTASVWALVLLTIAGLGAALYAFAQPSTAIVVSPPLPALEVDSGVASNVVAAPAASSAAPASSSSASSPPSASSSPKPTPKITVAPAKKPPVPHDAPGHDDHLLDTR